MHVQEFDQKDGVIRHLVLIGRTGLGRVSNAEREEEYEPGNLPIGRAYPP